jgi:hypothetical protein
MLNTKSARVRAALLALGAIGLAACSDSISPVAPTSQPSLAAAKGNANGKGSGSSALLLLTQAQFDALRTNWGSYTKLVADGSTKAEALRCEPAQRASATKRIGAKGGQITLGGGHSLTIPAGALASDVDITMESRPGAFLELRFSPHGLKFAKPVEMTFSYARCAVSADQAVGIVYVGSGFRILETMPSTDRRTTRKMSALTDHFSGYMMSTGLHESDEDQGGQNDW